MKRRAFKLFSLLVLLSSFIQPAIFAASSNPEFKPELKMSINGVAGKFNYGEPAIENGRSLIPVRDLLVNLGVSDDDQHIIWDTKTRTVTVIRGEITISLAVDSTDIIKNGKVIQKLEVPAKIINNRVYLPARAVAEALDFSVSYDEKSQNILITDLKPADTSPVDTKPADATPKVPKPADTIPIDPNPNEITPASNDTTSPTVTAALASTGFQIEVTFSEPVDRTTAENITNYAVAEKYGTLSNLNIISAVQEADSTKVKLTTGPQKEFTLYTLAVSNVKDIHENTIVPTPIVFMGSKGAPAVTAIDPNAPSIVSAKFLSKTTVEVLFGRSVEKTSAETAANYNIKETYGLRTGLVITGAKLKDDGLSVILTTEDQSPSLYSLTVANITDSSGNKIITEKPLTFVGFFQQ
ncbi:MAG: copper amine oxidase family protein [Bacilli bacterium]|nr:copper amine oxidase family protein [Bacilli bacterium]